MGSVSTTVSGLECQAWAATSPHVPGDTITDDKFPDGSRAAANNYCRNPNGYGRGPWCYTTDPNTVYEKCDIPLCPGKFISRFARAVVKYRFKLLPLHSVIRLRVLTVDICNFLCKY